MTATIVTDTYNITCSHNTVHLRRFYGSIRHQDLPGTPGATQRSPFRCSDCGRYRISSPDCSRSKRSLGGWRPRSGAAADGTCGDTGSPTDLTNISRSATIPFTVLQAEADQFEGLDVLQIGSVGLEMPKEHGADMVVDYFEVVFRLVLGGFGR